MINLRNYSPQEAKDLFEALRIFAERKHEEHMQFLDVVIEQFSNIANDDGLRNALYNEINLEAFNVVQMQVNEFIESHQATINSANIPIEINTEGIDLRNYSPEEARELFTALETVAENVRERQGIDVRNNADDIIFSNGMIQQLSNFIDNDGYMEALYNDVNSAAFDRIQNEVNRFIDYHRFNINDGNGLVVRNFEDNRSNAIRQEQNINPIVLEMNMNYEPSQGHVHNQENNLSQESSQESLDNSSVIGQESADNSSAISRDSVDNSSDTSQSSVDSNSENNNEMLAEIVQLARLDAQRAIENQFNRRENKSIVGKTKNMGFQ